MSDQIEGCSDEVARWIADMQEHDRRLRRVDEGGCWAPPGVEGWSAGWTISVRRRLLEWSQAELARRSGLRQADVSRVERDRDVKLSTLLRLAAALGCEGGSG